MRIAVSPYHLTTKEPAATAAFLLAGSVVTMLPAPFNGNRRHAEELSARIPKYLDFIQSWRWTVPLWNAGVVSAAVGDQDAVEDVRAICARIADDARFSPLRPLMRPELFDTEESYLESVARDLLKAGPDPAITVPVAAGMDRFSIRCGLVPARSDPLSVVQRLLLAPLKKCHPCRLQFYDWRPVKAGAVDDVPESAVVNHQMR